MILGSLAWPIKINQPSAVTESSTLSSEQIDYFLKNYPQPYSSARYSQTPSSYLPDPEYARASRDIVQQQFNGPQQQQFNGPKQQQQFNGPQQQQFNVPQQQQFNAPQQQHFNGPQQQKLNAPQQQQFNNGPQQQAPPHQFTYTPQNINEQLPPVQQVPAQFYFVPTIQPYPKQTQGYDFYFPQPEDTSTNSDDAKDVYYRELQPPKQVDEPNYYALKPKKGTKKYDSQKKQINLKSSESVETTVAPTTEPSEYQFEDYYALNGGGQATHQNFVTRKPERLTPVTAIRTLRQDELNTGEYLPSILRKGNDDNERVEFQMHGFNGPNSYKFGFDTGKG